MIKLLKKTIPYTSLRLNLLVVGEMVLLLLLSLAVMLYFSRQALVDGAKRDVQQRQMAHQQETQNIQHNIELTTRYIYQDLKSHLDQPERMYTYCRKIVESNHHIVGCAIVFKPYYYKDRELMMAYVHRKTSGGTAEESTELVRQEVFTDRPYTEQKWYTEPMKLGKECWVDLVQQGEYEGEALTTFCLPIYDKNNQCVGVIGTDLNIEHKKEIAYSDAEVFHSFRYLTFLVLAVTVVGILLFVILCRMVIRREMRPLRMLTKSAQRVADGNFQETVPDTQRDDEIGQLQELFKLMQQSLASKSAELEQLTTRLTTRSEELRWTLDHAQGSDRMKTSFLHYMTTQMTEPSDLIERSVMKLCNNYYTLTPQEADYEVEVIKTQSEIILDLLDHMVEALNIEAEEAEKEVRVIKEGKEVSDGQD